MVLAWGWNRRKMFSGEKKNSMDRRCSAVDRRWHERGENKCNEKKIRLLVAGCLRVVRPTAYEQQPWYLTSWPSKLVVSFSCPADHYCHFAPKSIHSSLVINISTVEYRCSSTNSRYQQTPPRHASVNLVYDKKSRDVTPKTTEQNFIVRIVNQKLKK